MKKPSTPQAKAVRPEANSRRQFLNAVGSTALFAATASAADDAASEQNPGQQPQKPKKVDFKEYVTQRLDELASLTAIDGPIYSELVKIRESLNALSSRLDACNQAIGDPNQIAAVNETLKEIKRVLGIP